MNNINNMDIAYPKERYEPSSTLSLLLKSKIRYIFLKVFAAKFD